MKKNMGSVDRLARAAVGAGALALGYVYNSWWGFIGLVPLVTSALGVCPAYLPFGINTCRATVQGK